VSLYNDAFALCVPDAAAQALELEHRTAPATCSPGKQALGGGCVGPVTESRPEETGWTCDNGATAHVICGAASRHQ